MHTKARPIFKAAKKAHETIEDTKLLLKHTEQEIVQLDSQEVVIKLKTLTKRT